MKIANFSHRIRKNSRSRNLYEKPHSFGVKEMHFEPTTNESGEKMKGALVSEK